MRYFRHSKTTSVIVLALAACVFLFALNAKLSLCYPTGAEHSRTALKLYLNGQKLDVLTSIQDPALELAGMVVLELSLAFTPVIVYGWQSEVFSAVLPHLRHLTVPHSFRPPPGLLSIF